MQHTPFGLLDSALALRIADYAHPNDVLQDAGLDMAQKRAILSAWASDACAVESRPAFRWMPGTPGPIPFAHVRQAVATLDWIADQAPGLFGQFHPVRRSPGNRRKQQSDHQAVRQPCNAQHPTPT